MSNLNLFLSILPGACFHILFIKITPKVFLNVTKKVICIWFYDNVILSLPHRSCNAISQLNPPLFKFKYIAHLIMIYYSSWKIIQFLIIACYKYLLFLVWNLKSHSIDYYLLLLGLSAFFDHNVYIHLLYTVPCTHSYVKRWQFCTPCFKKFFFCIFVHHYTLWCT